MKHQLSGNWLQLELTRLARPRTTIQTTVSHVAKLLKRHRFDGVVFDGLDARDAHEFDGAIQTASEHGLRVMVGMRIGQTVSAERLQTLHSFVSHPAVAGVVLTPSETVRAPFTAAVTALAPILEAAPFVVDLVPGFTSRRAIEVAKEFAPIVDVRAPLGVHPTLGNPKLAMAWSHCQDELRSLDLERTTVPAVNFTPQLVRDSFKELVQEDSTALLRIRNKDLWATLLLMNSAPRR